MGAGLNLETPRLRLCPLTRDDLEDLVALHADPQVMGFISRRGESREEVMTTSLTELLNRRTWAVFDQTAKFLGWVSLRPEGEEAELGYRFHSSTWNQGYATEAARAVTAWGFEALSLHRIWAQTMAINLASRRVMEKVGLAYVRTFHLQWDDPLPGSEQGEVEYAILRAVVA